MGDVRSDERCELSFLFFLHFAPPDERLRTEAAVGVLFVASVLFKQIALYYSLPFFACFVGRCWRRAVREGGWPGFARSAGALDIICAAGEASGSGVLRRLTRGRAQACVAWRRRAGAGREYRGAPSSARCLRAPSSQDPLSSEFRLTARHRERARCSKTSPLIPLAPPTLLRRFTRRAMHQASLSRAVCT